MADVVAGLAVFGAVIAVGWLLVRTRAVPADADGVLTRVCFFAATPALLVTTLSRADLTAVLSRSTAVAVAAELTAIVSAWCLPRLVLRRPTAEATIGALASGYVNAANLGIPVAVLVLGDAATIAPILLLQLLVLTPATFTVLDAVTRRGHPAPVRASGRAGEARADPDVRRGGAPRHGSVRSPGPLQGRLRDAPLCGGGDPIGLVRRRFRGRNRRTGTGGDEARKGLVRIP